MRDPTDPSQTPAGPSGLADGPSFQIKQQPMIGGSRYADQTSMYPGPHVMTWVKPHRFLPFFLIAIEKVP